MYRLVLDRFSRGLQHPPESDGVILDTKGRSAKDKGRELPEVRGRSSDVRGPWERASANAVERFQPQL